VGRIVFSRFWNWLAGLFSRPREHYDPSADPFLELDLEEVRKGLRPTQQGEVNGSRDYPPSDARTPDSVEHAIMVFFSNELERCVKECELRLSSYNERLGGLRAATAVPDLQAIAERTAQDLTAVGDRGSNELFAEQRGVAGLTADLERFKKEHGLSRQPDYPESHVLHYGVLCGILVVEVFLNGMMLARGDRFGYLGGGTQALVIALLNVLAGFSTGKWCFPLFRYRDIAWRAVAAAGTSAYAAFAVLFNLAVGHYRDALANPFEPNAAAETLRTIAISPLQFADVQSYMLFALGIVFSIVAFVDGYKTDDPYPGYGKIARRLDRARDEFAAARRECMDELAATRDRGLTAVKEAATAVEVAHRQIGALLNRQQHIGQRFAAHREYLQRCFDSLLAEYRTENQRVRKSPPPEHFFVPITLKDYRLTEYAPPGVDSVALLTAIERAVGTITGAYASAVERLRSVEELSQVDPT
jgi:hypothetical protein